MKWQNSDIKQPPFDEKFLVAEQPGWNIFFSSIVFSLFLGLIVRAIFSPDRVREHIQKAAQQIHQSATISFSKAYVSLADGSFPELAVLVRDIKLESHDDCLMRPLIEINEMKLPLSFSKLLAGEVFIDKILIDETNLSLSELGRNCQSPQPHSAAGENSDKSKTDKPKAEARSRALPRISSNEGDSSVPAPGEVVNISKKYPIDAIEIHRLNVHYLPVQFTSFYFDDLVLNLANQQPLIASLEGRMLLSRDQVLGYASGSKIEINYDETQGKLIQIKIQGGVSEGSFEFEGLTHLDQKKFEISGDIQYFPIAQLLPVLKKYRVLRSDFNGRRVWLSGKVNFSGETQDLVHAPVRISQAKLEGDLGEITIPQLEVSSLEPFQFKPFDVEMRRVSIGEVRKLLSWDNSNPFLGNLGEFNGTLHVENQESWVLRGDHLGLEFIFSNRGIRKPQTISLISGEVEFRKNKWSAKIDRIRPFEGVLEGEIKLSSAESLREVKVDAKIRELNLSPQIQNLMTGGGEVGSVSGDIQLIFQKNVVEDLRGQLRLSSLLVDGVQLGDSRLKLNQLKDVLNVQFSSHGLKLKSESEAGKIFRNVFGDLGTQNIELKNIRIKAETKSFQSFRWAEFSGDSEFGRFSSQGGWDMNSRLEGSLQFGAQGTKKPLKKWSISGTRNDLQIK